MTDTSDTPEEPISGDVVSEPDTSGEWLSPGLAAGRLGVSERTLWRMVRAGRYHRRMVDRRAEILVPDTGATSSETDMSVTPVTADSPIALELRRHLSDTLALVERQAVENADLRERVGRAEAAIDGANARAEQYAIDTMEQTERAVRAEAELERLRGRRWWRRIWQG